VEIMRITPMLSFHAFGFQRNVTSAQNTWMTQLFRDKDRLAIDEMKDFEGEFVLTHG